MARAILHRCDDELRKRVLHDEGLTGFAGLTGFLCAYYLEEQSIEGLERSM